MSDFVRSLPGTRSTSARDQLLRIHLDPLLLLTLVAIIGYGLVVLYSAVNRDEAYFTNQLVRIGLAFLVMVVAAQLDPGFYRRWMLDPRRIDPSTRMPQYADDQGKTAVQLLGSDARAQFDAIYDFLRAGRGVKL